MAETLEETIADGVDFARVTGVDVVGMGDEIESGEFGDVRADLARKAFKPRRLEDFGKDCIVAAAS